MGVASSTLGNKTVGSTRTLPTKSVTSVIETTVNSGAQTTPTLLNVGSSTEEVTTDVYSDTEINSVGVLGRIQSDASASVRVIVSEELASESITSEIVESTSAESEFIGAGVGTIGTAETETLLSEQVSRTLRYPDSVPLETDDEFIYDFESGKERIYLPDIKRIKIKPQTTVPLNAKIPRDLSDVNSIKLRLGVENPQVIELTVVDENTNRVVIPIQDLSLSNRDTIQFDYLVEYDRNNTEPIPRSGYHIFEMKK